MIYKEELKKNILLWKEFLTEWDKNPILNRESNLYELPGRIFDNFMCEVLTEWGADLLFWWLYEDVNKIIYYKDESSSIDVNKLDDLLDYMYKNSKDYLK